MHPKLLVVEDIGFINTKIKKIGIEHGYDVYCAKDLAETQKHIGENQFDLAIVDYRLPDAAYGEAVALTTDTKIPTIVVTAKIDEKLREDILSRKVVDYFQKDSVLTFNYIDRILTRLEKNPLYSVLVVDDSKMARATISQLLKRQRFKVLEAENGFEALEVLKNHDDIKIIITDHEMPEMDGIELVREVRSKHSKDDIAILGISGNGNSAMSAKFLKYGANDFITKPFCDEEFYCRLSHNIDFLEQIWQIKKSANTDFLTKLHNRRYLTEAVENETNYRIKPINLAMLDIDHFKRINDGFGHDVGDLALTHLAKLMMRAFPNDLPARFGGEEFCIVSKNMTPDEFKTKLEGLRVEIESTPLHHNDKDINFTVSIGTVFSSKSLGDMLVDADMLLYKAKKLGRNTMITENH